MADYQLTEHGVLRTRDGLHIARDTRNRLWREYQDWLDVPNVPDAEDLAAVRTEAKAVVDTDAELERTRVYAVQTPADAWRFDQRFAEAVAADADGTPTAAEYPILAAEVGHNGVDIEAVADNVLAEVATINQRLGEIEEARLDFHASIDAAGTAAAIRAIRDRLGWPHHMRPTAPVLEFKNASDSIKLTVAPAPARLDLTATTPTITGI